MIVVLQRVSEANVSIQGKMFSKIGKGLLILLGIGKHDSREDVDWLLGKLSNMRIFSDIEGKMNLSLKDVQGEALVVSQFTLLATTKKGNRPSFTEAAKPEVALPLYELFVKKLQEELNKQVKTGEFGADMQITLVNDGPVTICLDSKNRS
jgi:D-tyrosyl-tRNA(Tyr) deacylase